MKKLISSLWRFGAAFVVGIASLLVINVGHAFAVLPPPDGGSTCLWTGADGGHLADGNNWSGCTGVNGAPGALDNLSFDNSNWSGNETLVNDLSVSAGQVYFFGTGDASKSLIISPDNSNDTLVITKGILNNTSGASIEFDSPLTLQNDQTLTGASIDDAITLGNFFTPSTVGIGTSAITVSNVLVNINDAMSGIGDITVGSTLGLYGNNTYSGAITVSSVGTLLAGESDSFGTGTVTVSSGGTLEFVLSADATVNNDITLSGTGVNGNTGTLLVDGFDTATLTLSGTVTLNSDITYGGVLDTTITPGQGKSFVSNSHNVSVLAGSPGSITTPAGTFSAPVQTITIPASDKTSAALDVGFNQTYIVDGQRGATTVASGGVLEGTGTVGDLSVDSGGTVAPGHSPGCLNTGNLIEGGTYNVEIGGTTACTGYDQLKVTGTVDLTNGTLNTSLYGGFTPSAGQTYTIIDNDSTDAVTGNFTNLPEGATFTVSGYVFQVTYKGGDGNDVVLTVKSVPATPDTGLAGIGANPLLPIGSAVLAAGALTFTARKASRRTN